MRTIKFRAWNGEKMIYVGVLNLSEFEAIDYYHWYSGFYGESVIFKHDEKLLMQFTGLKDKNGKDIYEGDIIKKPNNQWGVIVYKSPFFEVTIDESQSCMYSREWFDDVEVIGNIHENPELLK